jgi:hypothetical protein
LYAEKEKKYEYKLEYFISGVTLLLHM